MSLERLRGAVQGMSHFRQCAILAVLRPSFGALLTLQRAFLHHVLITALVFKLAAALVEEVLPGLEGPPAQVLPPFIHPLRACCVYHPRVCQGLRRVGGAVGARLADFRCTCISQHCCHAVTDSSAACRSSRTGACSCCKRTAAGGARGRLAKAALMRRQKQRRRARSSSRPCSSCSPRSRRALTPRPTPGWRRCAIRSTLAGLQAPRRAGA